MEDQVFPTNAAKGREQIFEAKVENLNQVLAFVDEQLEAMDCSMKVQMQIDIALEELFVNVAHYAYQDSGGREGQCGTVVVSTAVSETPRCIYITLADEGIPFDPTGREEPDVTLPLSERQIGGLGIFMVRKSMDGMHYERKDGKNCLTFWKKL